MVEEIAQAEKEERKARLKTRMLWVLIGIDVLLFVYIVIEIILLLTSVSK